MSKRTNFKLMSKSDFIKHLNDNSIEYSTLKTTTVLGLSVVTIKPDHFRLGERIFELKSGKQIDSTVELTNITIETKAETEDKIENNVEKMVSKPISKKQLIKIIDNRIQNMGTKGVYHPKRLKPKWNSLTNEQDKLVLFEKHITNKESSIGFLKLIKVNLCHKTLEAIIIEYPSVLKHLKSKEAKAICIAKFSKYDNGKIYLSKKKFDLNG